MTTSKCNKIRWGQKQILTTHVFEETVSTFTKRRHIPKEMWKRMN
jgi:hypothetical protein